MELSLIRHGKSVVQHNRKLTYAEFIQWLANYDSSGIILDKDIPRNTINKAENAPFLITSKLKRSIESAKYLNPEAVLVRSSLFNEVHFPIQDGIIENLQFSPIAWLAYLSLHLVKDNKYLNRHIEDEKLRAKKASQVLFRLANRYSNLVVVGHGIFNLLLGEEFIQEGWRVTQSPTGSYWSCTTYQK